MHQALYGRHNLYFQLCKGVLLVKKELMMQNVIDKDNMLELICVFDYKILFDQYIKQCEILNSSYEMVRFNEICCVFYFQYK